MIIPNQVVTIYWRINTKKIFVDKGYKFTKIGDPFEINVEDLTDGSHTMVRFICDYCDGENQTEEKYKWNRYRNLKNNLKNNKKDCCIPCRSGKAGAANFNKDKSLKVMCPNLLNEWDYTKNKITPDTIGYKSSKKAWWKCQKGHEWEALIHNRAKGNSNCPYCSNKRVCIDNCLYTVKPDLAKEWHPTKNGELTPHDIVYVSKKNIWWRCVVDKSHEWKSKPSNRVYNGHGCPICNESKGEKEIRRILQENNIKFEHQYEFPELLGLGGGRLKFDFAVFNKGNIRTFMMEYDGEFHYKKFYENDGYEILKKHDERKNEYCEQNNIPLVRIPYWEFDNIEEILKKELIKYNVITPS